MTVHADRGRVLDTIEAFDTYKRLLVIVGIMAAVSVCFVLACNIRSEASLRSLWFSGVLLLFAAYTGVALYAVNEYKKSKKHYVGIHKCFIKAETDRITGIQMIYDGRTEKFSLRYEDIEWIMPTKKPGFYIARTNASADKDDAVFPDRRKAMLVIATAYDLEDFKEIYKIAAQHVKDTRNDGREDMWEWPHIRQEYLRIYILLSASIILIPWRMLLIISNMLIIPIIYVVLMTAAAIGGFILYRRYANER